MLTPTGRSGAPLVVPALHAAAMGGAASKIAKRVACRLLGVQGDVHPHRRCRSYRSAASSRRLLPVGGEISSEAQATRSGTRLDEPLVPVNLVATRAHGCPGDALVALGCHPPPFLGVLVPKERSRAIRRWRWSMLSFHRPRLPWLTGATGPSDISQGYMPGRSSKGKTPSLAPCPRVSG